MSTRAQSISLTDDERRTLERTVKAPTATQRDVQRARIVLLAADGLRNQTIAARLGINEHSVSRWRTRFAHDRLRGLRNRLKTRTPIIYSAEDRRRVVETACTQTPPGATHWSVRSLAEATGIGRETVRSILNEADLRPHRTGTFTRSPDPEFAHKLTDVVGLYLEPPEHAVVLCVDEKTQVQALDRMQPMLPMKPGQIERRTHDYKRHGTTQLFAALDVAAGQVQAQCQSRHRSEDFLRFMDRLVASYPGQELHVVLDNVSSHKSRQVHQWLERHPRVQFHYTPTYASWLNLVEVVFGQVQAKVVARGVFSSTKDLISKLLAFIDHLNQEGKRFRWTKSPDDILASLERLSGH